MAVGQRLEVTIDELVAGGEALARYNGFAIFVPYGAPGDRLEIEIVSVKPNYARGVLRKVRSPGESRIEPPCPVFGRCGGCQWQHIRYPTQLAAKQHIVATALERIGHVEVGAKVQPIVGMADPWHYRSKAHWAIAPQGKASLSIGLYEERSHRVVGISECAIQHPLLNLVLDTLRHCLPAMSLPVYDERTGTGWLRSCFAKVGYATDQLLIGLVGTTRHLPGADAFVAAIRDRFPKIDSIVLNVNPKRTNALLGDRTIALWGEPHLEERVGGLRFRLS
ncbi:MAG: 23S rRNA (uracil(1939)-C(5))-methyltransferase RlmD, partial [Cyanobacteria bacterium REEB65]|nr:23S rRNA (uracil(1939)-C(5))-methyltransferase RlmD [Cyanobacteria bacterium REEB65]